MAHIDVPKVRGNVPYCCGRAVRWQSLPDLPPERFASMIYALSVAILKIYIANQIG